MKLVSRITHENVTHIEIRRGEGLEGGDQIIISTERNVDTTYMFPVETSNRYRLRYRIEHVELTVEEEVAKQLKEQGVPVEALSKMIKEEYRVFFPKLQDGSYPRVVLELVYDNDKGKLRIHVTKPQQG